MLFPEFGARPGRWIGGGEPAEGGIVDPRPQVDENDLEEVLMAGAPNLPVRNCTDILTAQSAFSLP
jgi:hypothetical protein